MTLLSNKNFLRNALITVYILIVLGISATARATVSINPVFGSHEPVQTKEYTGRIMMTEDSHFFLVSSRSEIYELMSNIDLTEYSGLLVQIDGYEVKHKVGPVMETASVDPLHESSELPGAPVLIIFEISEVVK